MENLAKHLGREKVTTLTKDFNLVVDKYRKLADASGCHGELKFKKKGGYVDIFVEMNN